MGDQPEVAGRTRRRSCFCELEVGFGDGKGSIDGLVLECGEGSEGLIQLCLALRWWRWWC